MDSTLRLFFCGGAIGLLGALPLASQELSGLTSLQDPQAGVSPVELREGALRGIGPSYRASFDCRGFEFTPALGADAPRTMPWRFEVESIVRGTEMLWRAEGSPAAEPVVVADGGVGIARGEAVIETYELRPDGVKQCFVFDRWGSEGDLVVRGRVHSELAAMSSGKLQEVAYDFGGLGGVQLGKVLGIDGDGALGQGHYRVDGDVLEMVLPEAFVARAAAPLVLDPLVGVRRSGPGSTSPDRAPRIAYEASNDIYLAVWERAFSIADVEVRGALRNPDATGSAGQFVIATGGLNRNPDVNRLGALGSFVVVYEHSSAFLAPRAIRGSLVSGSSGSVTPAVDLSNGADCIHPTVAGTSDAGVPLVLVAWEERGNGIGMCQVAFAGTGLVVGNRRTVESNGDFRSPAFSRSSNRFHALAYEEYLPNAGRSKLWIRRVGLDTQDASVRVSMGPSGTDSTAPAIDGDDYRFRLVHVRTDLSVGDPQIHETQVEWNPNDNLVSIRSEGLLAETADAEGEPSVCLLGPLYLVAWSVHTNTNDREVHAMTRGLRDCVPCGREYVMSTARDSDSGPCVFSRYSGDPSQTDAIVAWSSFDATYPFNSQVFFQQFTAFVGRSLSASGIACGDAPSISQIGTYAIGSPDFGVAMDAGSAAVLQSILLISVDGSLTPTCGNCAMLTTPIAFPTTMTSATTGEVGIPIPCDSALDGGTLWFQFANIGSPNGDCALVPVLSLSRRLSAALRD